MIDSIGSCCELLFVYGTLRKGAATEMGERLQGAAEFVCEARCRGRLYLVDGYPGMVASGDPSDAVLGELYRMRRPDELLTILDDYEECGEAFPEPREYVRRVETVTLREGESREAWVYRYNRPVSKLERIVSGDFLNPFISS